MLWHNINSSPCNNINFPPTVILLLRTSSNIVFYSIYSGLIHYLFIFCIPFGKPKKSWRISSFLTWHGSFNVFFLSREYFIFSFVIFVSGAKKFVFNLRIAHPKDLLSPLKIATPIFFFNSQNPKSEVTFLLRVYAIAPFQNLFFSN